MATERRFPTRPNVRRPLQDPRPRPTGGHVHIRVYQSGEVLLHERRAGRGWRSHPALVLVLGVEERVAGSRASVQNCRSRSRRS